MMNEEKCKEYSSEELERLVHVKYLEREELFSCSSCNYFMSGDYCRQKFVRTHVEPYGVCIHWEGETKFNPKKC